MSYSMKAGETVSLNALVSRNNKFVPPMPKHAPSNQAYAEDIRSDLSRRLLNGAKRDVRRNNPDALLYVIRHTA